MRARITQLLSHKLNRDIAWTFSSFAVLAASGILMNLLIAAFRDAESLGIFNISYAIYLIASQFAALGIHYSVLRYTAYYAEDAQVRGTMLGSAMALSVLMGLISGAVLYVAKPVFLLLFDHAMIADSIQYAALGLLLFPLNKVLVSTINGLRNMRAFAIVQSLRYLAVLVTVAIVCVSDIPFHLATLSFFSAELLTCVVCLFYLHHKQVLRHLRMQRYWLKHHLAFGSKAAAGGIFLDMNTRLDVLILGGMLSPREVGIYSFAAMLVDGVQHILAIVRVNFNPLLVTAIRDQDWPQATNLLRQSRKFVTLGVAGLSLLILLGFWVIVTWIVPEKGFAEATASLCVLLAGFVLVGGFSPFDNLPMATGHPFAQTIQAAAITVVNILCCVTLVPVLGILGAAMGTAFGYMAGLVVLLILSYRLLGWNMLTNQPPVIKTT